MKCPHCKREFKEEDDIGFYEEGKVIYGVELNPKVKGLDFEIWEIDSIKKSSFFCQYCKKDLDIGYDTVVKVLEEIKEKGGE